MNIFGDSNAGHADVLVTKIVVMRALPCESMNAHNEIFEKVSPNYMRRLNACQPIDRNTTRLKLERLTQENFDKVRNEPASRNALFLKEDL